jgi:hypothetical protein
MTRWPVPAEKDRTGSYTRPRGRNNVNIDIHGETGLLSMCEKLVVVCITTTKTYRHPASAHAFLLDSHGMLSFHNILLHILVCSHMLTYAHIRSLRHRLRMLTVPHPFGISADGHHRATAHFCPSGGCNPCPLRLCNPVLFVDAHSDVLCTFRQALARSALLPGQD